MSRFPDTLGFVLPDEMPDVLGNARPTTLGSGTFLVLAADTYVAGELSESYLVVGFDLNRDGAGVWLHAPAESGRTECDHVVYPDQHDNFTWARQPDGGVGWCAAVAATPGTPNATCLCEAADSAPPC